MKISLSHKQSLYFSCGFIILVLFSNFLLQKVEVAGRVSALLVWGTIVDVMVVIPGVVFLFILRRKPAVSVLAPMMMVGLFIVHWLVPPYAKESLVYLNYSVIAVEVGLVGIELTILFLFLKTFPQWKRNFKNAQFNHPFVLGRMYEANRITFAPYKYRVYFQRLSGFLATDVSAVRYALFPQLDRYPPEECTFSYHKKSEYFGVFLMLIHAMVIEIIAVHVLLMQFSHTAAWLATILDVYALLFLIGDYQAIRKAPVHIGNQSLDLQKGLRFHISIPFEIIEQIRPCHQTAKECSSDKAALDLTLAGLEPAQPQYILELSQPLEAHLCFGLKREISRMYITVDEPHAFVEELEKHGVVLNVIN
ncbi:hypothetical protein [Halobacillus halophilus]|uniref:hypothetical protein n=1 Tax=Halobacillus halophilus TaxID=1570 RepID=UPI001CD7ABB9|nr:hypothetical protein [Halobacillus halophilus]MCA1012920.1 hypothetical protein [Halobacillus halophilus]